MKIILHDAMPLTEGEEILVESEDIVDAGVNHINPVEGTRVVLNNNDQLIVQETVAEIKALQGQG